MKHITKIVSCRANQWNKHGDSKRVDRLTTGLNKIPDCLMCGKPTEEHGWLDGVGVVHPGDWLWDVAGQTLILRDKTYQALLEVEMGRSSEDDELVRLCADEIYYSWEERSDLERLLYDLIAKARRNP